MMRSFSFIALVCLFGLVAAPAADWVRPGLTTNQPIWGLRGGLLWAVPPAGFRPLEPRGLIRLGYPILPGGGYDLVNFIAIEPIVAGRRAFSELEKSELDKVNGKRIWPTAPTGEATNYVPGTLRTRPGNREELEVTFRIEKFANGAHVRVVVAQRSDRPDEIELSVFCEADSAPLDFCILTATMGNMARTRELWLRDEVVSSLQVYRDYRDKDFAPHRSYPLSRLLRTADGGVLVALTNDEPNPAREYPFPGSRLWHYEGAKVTQYWAKAPGEFRDDLAVTVNGRYTYWLSARPIPGGVAFENFEWRERFRDGQKSVFGITRRTPEEMGFKR